MQDGVLHKMYTCILCMLYRCTLALFMSTFARVHYMEETPNAMIVKQYAGTLYNPPLHHPYTQ